jgi:flagellar export protein FliJ
MSKKAKDLDQLIRVNKWGVDERQRELGVLVNREEDLIDQGHRLDSELAEEQRIAATDPTMAGFLYGGFADHYRVRKEQLRHILHAIRLEIEDARERLADAYRQLKVYEEVQKNRATREDAEEARQEQVALDEIGMNQHRRRAQAG